MAFPVSRLSSALALGTAALAGTLALAGCGGLGSASTSAPAGPDRPVATWTGETLTLGDFESAYALSAGSWDEAADDSAGAYRDFLDRYVDFRLKVTQARAMGLDRDSALQAEMTQYRDQLARPYFLDQEVLDDIVEDLYQKQQEEVKASHLLLRVEENAAPADTAAVFARILALRDSALMAGGDFGALAVRHSQDPSAVRNRGDLGYFTGGRMVYEFEQAAYATPVGSVSMPIRTRFGYHLIKVDDRRPSSPEIRARHILIRIEGDAPADTAAARASIEQLRTRIAAGEDFETLARQYSDDTASGRNGGDLGFFGAGRMVQPFSDVAFALTTPGQVSDVVETQFGFHLIQFVEAKPRPTFAEAYPDLKRTAQELPRTATAQRALSQQLRAEAGGSVNGALIAQALAPFDADSLVFQLRRDGFGPFGAQPFATVGTRSYTFDDFLGGYRRQNIRPATDQRAQVREAMEAYLDERALDLALTTLESRDPEFRAILEQYADGVLLFRISEDSVWTPAAQDDAGLRAYHAARAGEYEWPRRRRVLAYTTPSDSLAAVVAQNLDAGMSSAAILAAHDAARYSLRLDTVLVTFDSTGTAIDETLALQPGQHTQALPERSRIAVYQLDGIEDPRPKTFEEARAEVVTDYQSVLEAAWTRRLRERYDAELYPERLSGAFRGPRPASAEPLRPVDPPGTAGTTMGATGAQ